MMSLRIIRAYRVARNKNFWYMYSCAIIKLSGTFEWHDFVAEKKFRRSVHNKSMHWLSATFLWCDHPFHAIELFLNNQENIHKVCSYDNKQARFLENNCICRRYIKPFYVNFYTALGITFKSELGMAKGNTDIILLLNSYDERYFN